MIGTRGEVEANLAAINDGISRACDRSGRDPTRVVLVAASKTVPIEPMRWAHEAGVAAFGENYVKELREKSSALPGVQWHFIGALQTHTAHHVASLAHVVETLASARATTRLARRAAGAGRTLDALIEVDLTGGRTGVTPETAQAFADEAAGLDGLRLVGLMTLPPMPKDPEGTRPFFVRLRELRDRIREKHPGVLELSMGMSLDYEVAVEEGATMVRIGTALFGPRAPLA
jgi:PLP dependent protein